MQARRTCAKPWRRSCRGSPCQRPAASSRSYFDNPEGLGLRSTRGGSSDGCAESAATRAGAATRWLRHPTTIVRWRTPRTILICFRIVASMHRAEARMRFARRAGPLFLGAAAARHGSVLHRPRAQGLADLRRPRRTFHRHRASAVTGPRDRWGRGERRRQQVRAQPLTTAVSSGRPGRDLNRHREAGERVPRWMPQVPGRKDASVTFASLQPQFGVKLRVDGAPGPESRARLDLHAARRETALPLCSHCQDRDGNELCVPKTARRPGRRHGATARRSARHPSCEALSSRATPATPTDRPRGPEHHARGGRHNRDPDARRKGRPDRDRLRPGGAPEGTPGAASRRPKVRPELQEPLTMSAVGR